MKLPNNKNDFSSFFRFKNQLSTSDLDNKVLNIILHDLNPSHTKVLSKLVSIQAFIGIISLLFCPQFNLSLTNNYELFHYFHRNFGEQICMLICGCIFIGCGAVFANYVLTKTELNKISQNKYLYYFSICSIALTSFLIFGTITYISLALYWFAGAYMGGLILFEINHSFRKHLL